MNHVTSVSDPGTLLRTASEVRKFAAEFELDPEQVATLATLDPVDVARFRRAVDDYLQSTHGLAFGRAAKASVLVPPKIGAMVAKKAFGPRLAARVAGAMPPDAGARLAGHMDVEFLASVSETLSPSVAADVVNRLPKDTIIAVVQELVTRPVGCMTIGRFVDAVSDEVILTVVDALEDDLDLLRIAVSIDPFGGLDRVLGIVPRDRIVGAVGRAHEAGELDLVIMVLLGASEDLRNHLVHLREGVEPDVVTAVVEHALALGGHAAEVAQEVLDR